MDLGSVTPTSATCFLATAAFDETPGFLPPALVNNFDVVQGFMNGMLAPFFAPFNCDITYGTPGPNAEDDTPGVSEICNVIVNGELSVQLND
jgi:hypothetical protein